MDFSSYFSDHSDLIFNIALSTVIASSIGFAYWYYSFVYVPHTHGPLSKIPGEGWPLWGRIKLNWHTVMGSRPLYIHRLHRKYGNTVLVGAHMVSCIDKKDVDKIYSTYQFPKADEYKAYSVYGGENIFSTRNRSFHALRRKIVSPIVSNYNLDIMENVVYEVGTVGLVNKFEKILKKTNKIDLFNEFHRSTVDVIFELFFESRLYMLENSWFPLITSFHYIFQFIAIQPVLPFVGIILNIFILIAVAIISATWYINPPKKDGKSVLSQFFEATDPDTGKKLTDAEVLREVLVIAAAGMDTTAVSLSWIFWALGMHPEVYKEIQKEIDTVFPNKDVPLCAETCRTMLPITEAVILECMRLYPASGEYLPRTAPQSGTKLGGYDIPGHTMVFSASYAFHRNPEIWDNPDEFNYKRWLIEDNSKLKSLNMVFSQGPRSCPGRALGWMEIFFIITAIAQRYDFKLCPGQEELANKPVTYFMMKPHTYSIKVEMKHREK